VDEALILTYAAGRVAFGGWRGSTPAKTEAWSRAGELEAGDVRICETRMELC